MEKERRKKEQTTKQANEQQNKTTDRIRKNDLQVIVVFTAIK